MFLKENDMKVDESWQQIQKTLTEGGFVVNIPPEQVSLTQTSGTIDSVRFSFHEPTPEDPGVYLQVFGEEGKEPETIMAARAIAQAIKDVSLIGKYGPDLGYTSPRGTVTMLWFIAFPSVEMGRIKSNDPEAKQFEL
jgi:hypothetical protein